MCFLFVLFFIDIYICFLTFFKNTFRTNLFFGHYHNENVCFIKFISKFFFSCHSLDSHKEYHITIIINSSNLIRSILEEIWETLFNVFKNSVFFLLFFMVLGYVRYELSKFVILNTEFHTVFQATFDPHLHSYNSMWLLPLYPRTCKSVLYRNIHIAIITHL